MGYRFSLDRHEEGFRVEASAEVGASAATVWATLTDYATLPRFVPGMHESRVLERQGVHRLILRQTGAASFGPFSESFDVTFAVEEQPTSQITAVAVAGDFVEFRSRYILSAIDLRRTRLDYRAQLQPRRDPPPLVGAIVMETVAERQFKAMLREIGRRAG